MPHIIRARRRHPRGAVQRVVPALIEDVPDEIEPIGEPQPVCPLQLGEAMAAADENERRFLNLELADAMRFGLKFDYTAVFELASRTENPSMVALAKCIIGMMAITEATSKRVCTRNTLSSNQWPATFFSAKFYSVLREFAAQNRTAKLPIVDSEEEIDLLAYFAQLDMPQQPLRRLVHKVIDELISKMMPLEKRKEFSVSDRPRNGHRTVDSRIWRLTAELLSKSIIVDIPEGEKYSPGDLAADIMKMCSNHCSDLFDRERRRERADE